MWHNIGAGIVAAYLFCKLWYMKLEPILTPLIKDVEARAADGIINLADRKAILMEGLQIAQTQGLLKLNFIEKIIVSKIVDMIAEKLPDINISKNASQVIDKAISNIQNK